MCGCGIEGPVITDQIEKMVSKGPCVESGVSFLRDDKCTLYLESLGIRGPQALNNLERSTN